MNLLYLGPGGKGAGLRIVFCVLLFEAERPVQAAEAVLGSVRG